MKDDRPGKEFNTEIQTWVGWGEEGKVRGWKSTRVGVKVNADTLLSLNATATPTNNFRISTILSKGTYASTCGMAISYLRHTERFPRLYPGTCPSPSDTGRPSSHSSQARLQPGTHAHMKEEEPRRRRRRRKVKEKEERRKWRWRRKRKKRSCYFISSYFI